MRKQCMKYHQQVRQDGGDVLLSMKLGDAPLNPMAVTVKDLIRQYKATEHPFL